MPFKKDTRRSPRDEYRLTQRSEIESSPSIAERFPRLKALKVVVGFFDASGTNRHGGVKYTVNLEHAKSALWFACPGVECSCGDFDLTDVLAQAVAEGWVVAAGELPCQGTRQRGKREPVVCGTRLRYKLHLSYN